LIKEFSLERVTPSPAVFDFDKLYWLNRHYLKSADPERIVNLVLPYLQQAQLIPEDAEEAILTWAEKVIALLVPYVDRLDQLPDKAKLFFSYDASTAINAEDNRPLLTSEIGRQVITRFTDRVHASANGFSADSFKAIINQVKDETGAKGKELFHPIRIVITGSHSGPDFDRVIPLIETGSHLPLPKHVLSVRERVDQFWQAFGLIGS
jgi:glutamyl-tRNA synthetase/nondiscriminating glutamyl-tRNA synthetase